MDDRVGWRDLGVGQGGDVPGSGAAVGSGEYGLKNTVAFQGVEEPLRGDHTAPAQQVVPERRLPGGAHLPRSI